MAIKKSELYSTLWASCDELRGGMDASQYKDYVLVMLFIKYISDKYAGVPYSPIVIPEGASFKDMVALKGKATIGDDINKKILNPIGEANQISDFPDFNDVNKLGSGRDMVNKLSNLIAIFENPELDFSRNKAEGDDILGDAYEYLMRHFATESGKSKGQFYTPAEVSRVMAQVIGIHNRKVSGETTVYDPTCGSGSLLLKVADQAQAAVSLYGQEMDVATASLARMNMILHNNPTAVIRQGNTLANPLFLDAAGALTTFDYVVANPPFSFKSWGNGVDPVNEPFRRFKDFGIPPTKNGDYAFLLHILRSLKSKGKGAVILPHGVLFRGNAEAEIRTNLIKKGYIKGIIGLPANLFYGTGIPACIIVLDKEGADDRKGIFIINAQDGFVKDGNKNRLRERDIHRIVDVFNGSKSIPGYSRMVPISEIEGKEYNLNIPRYIENLESEDIQDIGAHLNGGIPARDVENLATYWKAFPKLKQDLFKDGSRPGYYDLKIDRDTINYFITNHPDFKSFSQIVDLAFQDWKLTAIPFCHNINSTTKAKSFINQLSEELLDKFKSVDLIDPYAVYQHLLSYWTESMQDDVHLIVSDGWNAKISKVIVKNRASGRETEKGWQCDLLPKPTVICKYFQSEKRKIEEVESKLELLASELAEMEEEQGGEEGFLAGVDKVNKANVIAELKTLEQELRKDKSNKDSLEAKAALGQLLNLYNSQAEGNKLLREANLKLDEALLNRYAVLKDSEIKSLVIEDKWLSSMNELLGNELKQISVNLVRQISTLVQRYETSLQSLQSEVDKWQVKVQTHLSNIL